MSTAHTDRGLAQADVQQMEHALDTVYALLADVLLPAGAHAGYLEALYAVLQAALTCEQHQASVTRLPLLVCKAAGGSVEAAVPVAAAWRALQIAAKLLDDVEDGDVDPRQSHPHSYSRLINLSTALIIASSLALARLPADLYVPIQADFHHVMLTTAAGQHIDLSQRGAPDLATYFHLMGLKSAACFALAARAGARCARVPESQIRHYEAFGYNVGMMVQVGDDLADMRRTGVPNDLASGQPTLAVQYALMVAAPAERIQLQNLLACAQHDHAAEQQARQMIIGLGAEAYLLAELARYRYRAMTALEQADQSEQSTQLLSTWLMAFHTQPCP